jgi:predicted RNA-binding Zn ribbon-like protein
MSDTRHDHRAVIDPAPGEDASIALALANTLLHGPSGPADLLTDASAAGIWLANQVASQPSATLHPADLARLIRLRSAIRDVLGAVAAARQPAPSHVALLNQTTAAAPGAIQLRIGQQTLTRSWSPSGGPAFDIALAALAADAIELATGDRAEQIRQCEAHSCIRLFLREHARRRWCSNNCGDRVRAARHYQRLTHPTDT